MNQLTRSLLQIIKTKKGIPVMKKETVESRFMKIILHVDLFVFEWNGFGKTLTISKAMANGAALSIRGSET